MTFDEFNEQTASLARRITESGFAPDVLVAIARGGWVPARLLSKHLGVKRLMSFGVSYADAARQNLVCADEPRLTGQKILLIEDYLESGRSMLFCLDRLQKAGNEVKTFAVGYRKDSQIVPDFTAGLVQNVPSLPWD